MFRRPRVRWTPLVRTTVVGLLFVTFMAGCGAGSANDDHVVGKGAARHNSADVAFATQMIPHHAQAAAMVNLTLGRNLDPALAVTAEKMLTSQSAEVTKMSGWLQDWGKPVPRTMIDHVGHAMGDTSMPGALKAAEFHRLKKAKGAEFERAWLQAMIAHHEGAIRMAKAEQSTGANPAAKRLASEMIRTQRAELQQLRGYLSG